MISLKMISMLMYRCLHQFIECGFCHFTQIINISLHFLNYFLFLFSNCFFLLFSIFHCFFLFSIFHCFLFPFFHFPIVFSTLFSIFPIVVSSSFHSSFVVVVLLSVLSPSSMSFCSPPLLYVPCLLL